ncbi:hypothetical protein SERLA73DRAFT_156742 [Serpula lacrymans var. lacrymans S7.3]|uniref:WW domain-containing protein n=1 Tax=Serpula lacrymans var. lacrymans (strain S7.3) TaxID=936435 RepID=F8QFS1_SERL3|nr:hypothetical protein SERLA73DRAFT_156742 [Serpula lacrymans var. lacrymans S7.3]
MSQDLQTKSDSDISISTSPRVLTCPDTNTCYLKLNPTTSLCTGRTASLPPTWSSFIHPEGQRYYYCDGLKLRVVTEENMDDPHVATAVSFCVKWIEDTLWQRNIELPDSAELFLQLEDTQENSCSYYFVDHASRTEFWIDKMDTESLDMDPVVSASHLNLALEKLYWTHVEFFPMHLESRLPKEIVDSIIDVFSHGQADRMSSDSSTFPYTTDQCAQLLVLLNSRQGHNLNGYTICFVARLWNAICHHRFTSYYGQDVAQLDREQAMLPSDTPDHHWLTTACDWMLWNMPSFHIEKLNKLFVDNQVYVDQWCLVISACLSGWSSTLSRVRYSF